MTIAINWSTVADVALGVFFGGLLLQFYNWLIVRARTPRQST
jgi:hypothetical protein